MPNILTRAPARWKNARIPGLNRVREGTMRAAGRLVVGGFAAGLFLVGGLASPAVRDAARDVAAIDAVF